MCATSLKNSWMPPTLSSACRWVPTREPTRQACPSAPPATCRLHTELPQKLKIASQEQEGKQVGLEIHTKHILLGPVGVQCHHSLFSGIKVDKLKDYSSYREFVGWSRQIRHVDRQLCPRPALILLSSAEWACMCPPVSSLGMWMREYRTCWLLTELFATIMGFICCYLIL